MKDCWKILGIHRNNDLTTIKKAYRELIKKYHPDKVQSPEKKRKYTIKCAEIIDAYDRAMEEAKSYDDAFDYTSASSQAVSTPWYEKLQYIIGFIFVILFFLAISFVISKLSSLPDSHLLKITFGYILLFFMSLFFGGIAISSVINLFIIGVIGKSRFMAKLGLEKYEMKILWVLMVIINIVLFYFTEIGSYMYSSDRPAPKVDNAIWRAVGAGTLPVIFFLFWIERFLTYNRAKDKVNAIIEV